jgi:hypothetical protein
LYDKGSGKLDVELFSKGLGILWQAVIGNSGSALVSTGLYQQTHTMSSLSTPLTNSFTVQEGLVTHNGTVKAHTFRGCTGKSVELTMPTDAPGTVSIELDANSLDTATALTTPSYPTGGSTFTGALPASGALAIGGTFVAPTTTALAQLTTPTVASVAVASYSWKLENDVDDGLDIIGGRLQPTVGGRKLTGKATVIYNDATGDVLRDAQRNRTLLPWLFTSTTAEVIGAGVATYQFAFPSVRIEDGTIPTAGDGKAIRTDISFTVLDGGVAAPGYVVARTADTAL